MFADDTTISASGKNVEEITRNLQMDLKVIEKWCNNNAMVPNASKTKAVFISASIN